MFDTFIDRTLNCLFVLINFEVLCKWSLKENWKFHFNIYFKYCYYLQLVNIVYHNWSIFNLKLFLYDLKFKERKLDHEKSYTNQQYTNKIGYTCSRSFFSVSFNMVQLIFNKGYDGEIKRYTIPSKNKSYSIEEKQLTSLSYKPTKI